MASPEEVVAMLRAQSLRCRTGVLSLPDRALGSESEIAAALSVEMLDYREYLLSRVTTGARYLNLTLSRVFDDLDDIANAKTGESCVLIGNFDVAVARLRSDERTVLWRNLLTDFPHRTRALLLCIPSHNDESFAFPDSNIRRMWYESKRFAVWQIDPRGSREPS